MPEDRIWEITIGALLHDLGKFSQRARIDLSGPSKNIVGQICPFNEKGGYHTHLHVQFTHETLTRHSALFPKTFDMASLIQCAINHHKPSSEMEWIVARADRLASGQDRTPRERLENEETRYYEVPLHSIFDGVSDGKGAFDGSSHYALGQLSSSEAFPAKGNLSREKYKKFWEDFESDFEATANPNLSPERFLSTMLSLYERYGWCIPSTTIDEPDISLYDHSRLTAALSAALYRFHSATGQTTEEAIQDDETEKFLFVSGDLSGIQQYIFDLRRANMKGAAKMLRARSFEIQAFAEAACHLILDAFQLPSVCKIMNAGGRFLVLLPNVPNAQDKLSEIRREVDLWCLNRYQGQLSLNISGGLSVPGKMLGQDRAKEFFRALQKDIQKAKSQRLQSALKTGGDWDAEAFQLTSSYEEWEDDNACTSCGKRPWRPDDEKGVCTPCARLISLGRKLPKARYMAWRRDNAGDLSFFGGKISVSVSEEKDKIAPGAFALNSLNFWEADCEATHIAQHIPQHTLETIESTPPPEEDGPAERRPGDPITFGELAHLDRWTDDEGRTRGVAYLAMLKADVDNLGYIFANGLGSKTSISRFVSLSRMMNYFFNACIFDLIESRFPHIYTVFAGGDDLCVIGPWGSAIEFSREVRASFDRFCGKNPFMTLSAGIALASPSLPAPGMAAEAEELLEKSKREVEKNSLTLFETTISWQEAKALFEFGAILDEKLRERGKNGKTALSTANVRSLLRFRRDAVAVEKGRLAAVPWRARMRYYLQRNIENDVIRNELSKLIGSGGDPPPLLKNARLPVSFALYKNRKGADRS